MEAKFTNLSYSMGLLFSICYTLSHFGVSREEKLNIKRFGQEYVDYMKRVPRYFFGKI
jgi:protein-S-isoprenylcysteine O-methyltransferase Ste14